jgi:hypothetical protein
MHDDGGMMAIGRLEPDILQRIVLDAGFGVAGDIDVWKLKRNALALDFERLPMFFVNVRVPHKIDEFIGDQTRVFRQEMRQETIRQDIERNAQSYVATALEHRARQVFPFAHVELR